MTPLLNVLFNFTLYCLSSWGIVDVYSRRHDVKNGTYRSYFDGLKLKFAYDDLKTKFYMDFCLANAIHVMTELYFCYLLMKWV